MRLWDTNPRSNFLWPSLRTHLSYQMTRRELRNIYSTGNSCRDALPCANMALKLPRYLYLLMENPLGRYFPVRRHKTTRKHLFLYHQFDRSGLTESQKKKRISIHTNTATTSVNLTKSVSTGPTIDSDSSLTSPIGKDEVWDWTM